jgi:ribosome-binding factor A
MIDYRELRTKLDNSPPDQWDQIVEDAIDIYESKVNELPGEVMGSAVSDVEVEDGLVTASVYYCMLGDCNADEDGESYDQEESEYSFLVSITPGGTKWESA